MSLKTNKPCKDNKNAFMSDVDLLSKDFEGDLVRYMRNSLGVSTRKFAEILKKQGFDVTHQTLYNWENENNKPQHGHWAKLITCYLSYRNSQSITQSFFIDKSTIEYLKKAFKFMPKKDKAELIKELSDD